MLDPASDPGQDPFASPAPDPFQTPAQDPFQTPSVTPSQTGSTSTKDPNVSKTKMGLLLFIVGIVTASVLTPISTFLPTLLDARLAYVVPIPLVVGAVLVLLGRRAWPSHMRSAKIGLGAFVAGEASTIVLSLIGVPYFLSFQGQPTDVGSPYHNALLVRLIWETANVALVAVGIVLLLWRITSEAPRKLIVAGNLIFLGYYVAGHVLSIVLYDPTVGGVDVNAQPAVGILLGVFLLVLLATNALQTLGLVFARWRLPTPS